MKTTPSRWPFRKRDGINHVEIAPRATTDNGEAALDRPSTARASCGSVT